MSDPHAPSVLAVQHAEAILQWYLDNGVDEGVASFPVDRLAPKVPDVPQNAKDIIISENVVAVSGVSVSGTPEAKLEAITLATAAATLDALKAAISAFDALSLKKTAMNLVFADGNAQAPIMVIGDAPEADDDRTGVPFSGAVGQLADRMFAAIGLSRGATEPERAVYLTNVLNWRPPGNRTPLPAEIELSLPFLHRHIALVKPKALFLMGGLSSKALLGSDEAVGKLRGKKHSITLGDFTCPALVTYHPAFLLRSPLKKREAWDDLQNLAQLVRDI